MFLFFLFLFYFYVPRRSAYNADLSRHSYQIWVLYRSTTRLNLFTCCYFKSLFR